MANIPALARRARSKLAHLDPPVMANAIRRAIIGSGISNRADVDRLMKAVGTHIVREDAAERRGRHAQQRRAG
jgi:hypothetical protein